MSEFVNMFRKENLQTCRSFITSCNLYRRTHKAKQ